CYCPRYGCSLYYNSCETCWYYYSPSNVCYLPYTVIATVPPAPVVVPQEAAVAGPAAGVALPPGATAGPGPMDKRADQPENHVHLPPGATAGPGPMGRPQ